MAGTPTRKRLTPEARRAVIEQAATEVFAERGYHAASVDEIARRSGISVPVLYDHFASRQDLHRTLLERHYAELRVLWYEHMDAVGPAGERVARMVDTWFGYVESHPYAWRMLFCDTTGQDDAEAVRREAAERSRSLILPIFARERADLDSAEDVELAWEAVRAAIQGLALWWREHPHIPRAKIVAAAMNTIWTGLERVQRGEHWHP